MYFTLFASCFVSNFTYITIKTEIRNYQLYSIQNFNMLYSTKFFTYEINFLLLMKFSSFCNSYSSMRVFKTTLNLRQDLILTFSVLEHGYVATRLISLPQKFYGCHLKLADRYGIFFEP